VTPYTRLPISTDLAIRDQLRDGNLTAIYGILPYSAKSTKSCQVLPGPRPNPILLRVRIN